MRLDKATIKFEIEDKDIEMDILGTQMGIEKIQADAGDDIANVMQGVREMFIPFEVNLTDTQAWTVIQAVQSAYESFKKKLKAELESDFGTIPIHFRLEEMMSPGLTGSSPSSSQNENLSTENQQPT